MSSVMSGYQQDEVALVNDDFPWRHKADHPNDYIEDSSPMQPELLFHHVRGRHNRLWLRISWKLGEGRFVPMSFLLSTGAANHFYLSDRALSTLETAQLIEEDQDTEVEFTRVFGRKCGIEPTPASHHPANIIGLKMLKRMGLQLLEEAPHFKFSTDFQCLGA